MQRFWKRVVYFFSSIFNFFASKVTNNEVFNLNGLKKHSAICLNDIIKHRVPNMAGRDPEPLITEWISGDDYEWKVDRDQNGQSRSLEITYRTKINYLSKDPNSQSTAFVAGTATIKDGNVRTRQPRLAFMPFFLVFKFLSGLIH